MIHPLGVVGLFLVAVLTVFLAAYLKDFFSLKDVVSTIYLSVLSFFVVLTVYGLLLFLWGANLGLYFANGIFAVVAALLLVSRRLVRRNLPHEEDLQPTTEEPNSHRSFIIAVGVLGSVLTFGLGYLVYQIPAYPRGFDGGWHYVYVESLVLLGTLPTHELGTLVPPFYQRAYHMALGSLIFPTQLDQSLILESFNLLMYSAIPLAVWLVAFAFLRSKTIAALASLSSLFLASFIVVRGGNYPFLLSLHFLSLGLALAVYTIRAEKKLDLKLLVVMAVVGLLLIATHPVVAQIYVLFGAGFLVFGFRRQIRLHEITRALLPAYSLISGAAIYFILYPALFRSQLSFAFGRFSNAPGSDPFLTAAIRTAVPEAVILFLPMLLLPPALVGIIWCVRKRELQVLSFVSVAATLFFIQILPVTAREPYIVLFPMTLVAGIGLNSLFRSFSRSRYVRRKAVFSIFLVFTVAVSANTMVQVATHPMIGARVYLSDAELEFAEILVGAGISGRIMATLNDPSMARIGSLSGSDVVVGDRRYTTLEQYRDVYFMLLDDDCDAIGNSTSKYQIDSILLLEQWTATAGILLNYTRCFEDGILIEHAGIILFFWGS